MYLFCLYIFSRIFIYVHIHVGNFPHYLHLHLPGRPEDAKKAVATFDHGELNGILEDRQFGMLWRNVGLWHVMVLGFSVEGANYQRANSRFRRLVACMRRVELGRVGFVLLEGNFAEGCVCRFLKRP